MQGGDHSHLAPNGLLAHNVRRVIFPAAVFDGRVPEIIGRSINGRSGAFEALYLGSNPSRPTKLSTATPLEEVSAGGQHLGTVSRQQHAAEVEQVFGRREQRWRMYRSLKGHKSYFSQQSFDRNRCFSLYRSVQPLQGCMNRPSSRNYQGQPAWRVST